MRGILGGWSGLFAEPARFLDGTLGVVKQPSMSNRNR